ncbi:hypothetical protein KC19_7G148700 [Ceratodon purpureus]|uniref:Uncharacterized protein n=1 Tax=Ceratodon purpureus TaxID=3225 RepID=A0A8T0HB56_CERPU|nr:hypothetical protein KC19_7G148700 [Ceratodon purpureus]
MCSNNTLTMSTPRSTRSRFRVWLPPFCTVSFLMSWPIIAVNVSYSFAAPHKSCTCRTIKSMKLPLRPSNSSCSNPQRVRCRLVKRMLTCRWSPCENQVRNIADRQNAEEGKMTAIPLTLATYRQSFSANN